MGASIRSIEAKCVCGQKATHEVLDKFARPHAGRWCKKCAEQLARELDARDAPKKEAKK